jgi:hypothetical protein
MDVRNFFLLLFLSSFPAVGFCNVSNEDLALKLVKDYYGFISSYPDMPNAHFRAGEKFDHPDSGYEAPGGDDETYEIVEKDYKVIKVETKKDNQNDDVLITIRFKTIGILNLFKDGFESAKGIKDVTFYCSKSKGKYCVMDLSDMYIRFFDSAVKFLKEKIKNPQLPDDVDHWKSELKGLREASKINKSPIHQIICSLIVIKS